MADPTPDALGNEPGAGLDDLVAEIKELGARDFRIWSRTARAYVVDEPCEPQDQDVLSDRSGMIDP
jgi:hypothetical protein